MTARVLLAAVVVLTVACNPSDKARQIASRTSAEAAKLANTAASLVFSAKAKVFGLKMDGALSDSATSWLKSPKDGQASEGSMEGIVMRGVQIAPVVIEALQVLNEAVDEDTAIEPIYQKIDPPGSEPKVDEAIKNMPRVEIIDGVNVGFRQLDAMDTSKITKERAYLVTWRKQDRVVGFVYRTKRTIDIELLVKETPRLMKLMTQASSK